jgi:hypothetical protein
MRPRFAAAAVLLPIVLGCCAVNDNSVSPEPGERLRGSAFTRPPGGEGFYTGNDSCRACHETLFGRWRATEHAGSYAALAGGGDEKNPSCLRCHATGYGERRGFTGMGATPGLANVGCETCHGPSGDHARSRFPAMVGTGEGGDCGDCEVSRICRKCHTRRQSPGFVLARDLARVSCSPPVSAPGVVAGEE